MNNIGIYVVGLAGSGKTTIADIILRALWDAGFNGMEISDDGNLRGQPDQLKIDSLIAKPLLIGISTIQRQRENHDV